MRAAVLFLMVASSGCAVIPMVRQGDIDAWKGAPVAELQAHAFFSTIPKRVEPLEGGRELWTYSNCDVKGGSLTCCHNQFFVRSDRVEQYRVSGQCYTDCSVRPPSRSCKPIQWVL